MRTTRALQALLIVGLLATAWVHAADDAVQVAMEDGKTIAQFKIGDSRCALVDGQIRCSLGK